MDGWLFMMEELLSEAFLFVLRVIINTTPKIDVFNQVFGGLKRLQKCMSTEVPNSS